MVVGTKKIPKVTTGRGSSSGKTYGSPFQDLASVTSALAQHCSHWSKHKVHAARCDTDTLVQKQELWGLILLSLTISDSCSSSNTSILVNKREKWNQGVLGCCYHKCLFIFLCLVSHWHCCLSHFTVKKCGPLSHGTCHLTPDKLWHLILLFLHEQNRRNSWYV